MTAELDRGDPLAETPRSRAGRRTVTPGPSWCPRCAGTWSDSPRRGSGDRSSPDRRELPCAGPVSGRYGTLRALALACPALLFTAYDTWAGHLLPLPGASLKKLMARLGHSGTRAAMIYQHATRDRDQAIAKALGGLVQQVRMNSSAGSDEASGDA